MKKVDSTRSERDIDWSLTTWEGARREQMRRWAELPLERAIMALEEMETLFRDLRAGSRDFPEAREPSAINDRDDVP